nr:hypothetical protein [Bacillus licheniformis]
MNTAALADDRVFAEKNRAVIVAAMYCGYSAGGVLASLVGMFAVPVTSWRVLYLIGAVPLFVLPFFFSRFPESLSFYVLKKKTKALAEIFNQVHPAGRYREDDNYQISVIAKEKKGFPVKKLFGQKRAASTFAFWLSVFSQPSHGLRLKYMASENDAGVRLRAVVKLVIQLGAFLRTSRRSGIRRIFGR